MRSLVESADCISARATGEALAADRDAGVVELEIGGVWSQQVEIVSTPGNLGGRLRWFLCPSCGRRVAKLYLPSNSYFFLCRHCHGLEYRQQALREFRNAPEKPDKGIRWARVEKRRRDKLKMLELLADILRTCGAKE